MEPDRDAVLDVLERVVEDGRAPDEECEPCGDVERPARRHVQHREEDPEVEEGAPEVVRLDDDEHRRAPDRDERPEILEPSLRDDLPLLAQVPREEEDEADLRELARLELDDAEVHPQPRAVHLLADSGNRREEQQPHGGDAEEVAVRLEDAVVVPEPDERRDERRDSDGDPDGLARPVLAVEAVDRSEPERRQDRGQRQQHAVRVRDGPAHDDVRDEVEREEQNAPRHGASGHLGAPRQRDARERDARQQRGDDESGELAAPCVHRPMAQYSASAPTTTTSKMNASAASRPPWPAPCVRTRASGSPWVSSSASAAATSSSSSSCSDGVSGSPSA